MLDCLIWHFIFICIRNFHCNNNLAARIIGNRIGRVKRMLGERSIDRTSLECQTNQMFHEAKMLQDFVLPE